VGQHDVLLLVVEDELELEESSNRRGQKRFVTSPWRLYPGQTSLVSTRSCNSGRSAIVTTRNVVAAAG
jgi:hypothetical protein